jgi:hypothetical protein
MFKGFWGWGSALTHPDRGSLKETIKRAFPERLALSEVEVSRMGAPYEQSCSINYGRDQLSCIGGTEDGVPSI